MDDEGKEAELCDESSSIQSDVLPSIYRIRRRILTRIYHRRRHRRRRYNTILFLCAVLSIYVSRQLNDSQVT